jgi:hypothetical protein
VIPASHSVARVKNQVRKGSLTRRSAKACTASSSDLFIKLIAEVEKP